MKKTLIIFGITVAIVAIIKAPKMIHRYKTYALRAKISLAKSILKCSKENQNCIKPGELTYKDALKNCPKIQCLVENDTKFYKEFYRKPLSPEESILILKGNLFEDKKEYEDIWIQTEDGINIHCIDGAGWDADDKNPLCLNI